jgi:hypothetical protein
MVSDPSSMSSGFQALITVGVACGVVLAGIYGFMKKNAVESVQDNEYPLSMREAGRLLLKLCQHAESIADSNKEILRIVVAQHSDDEVERRVEDRLDRERIKREEDRIRRVHGDSQ